MASKPNWRPIAAQIIYHGYPDSDLLPIEPLGTDMTIGEYKTQAEEAGDTLFLFLCREADDEIDAGEYIDRLDRAIRDIEHVRDAVTAQLMNHVHKQSPPTNSQQ